MALVAVEERAGDEWADAHTAELLVVGALMERPGCPRCPTWSQAGAWHDTQHICRLSL